MALLNPLGPPVLKILTYSSFAGAYGPGSVLKEEFEKHCSCQVQWFLAEDSTLLAQRFQLLPQTDMILGWDQITKLSSLTGLSETSKVWENLSSLNVFHTAFLELIHSQEKWDFFIPYNWSPIGFLSKEALSKPSSLEDLKSFEGRFSIPEPRTSNLGLQFYYWLYEHYQADLKKIEEYLKQIKAKLYSPVPSWSMAYGFFRKGTTDLGFSYLSSLIYHEREEPHQSFFFLDFELAHPYQMEFFSISKKSKNKSLAFRFAKLLLSQKGQEILMSHNYMFPVSVEHNLTKTPELLDYDLLEAFIANKQELLDLWESSLH